MGSGGGSQSTTTNNYTEDQKRLQKGFADWAMPDGEIRQAENFTPGQIQDRGQKETAGLNQDHRNAQGTARTAATGWNTSSDNAQSSLNNSNWQYGGVANSNQFGGQANSQKYNQPAASAPEFNSQNLSKYMAPGADMVLNPALAGLHDSYTKGNTQLLGDASSRGALNNDRTGVAQANLASGYAGQVADTVGNHYMGLYDRATNEMGNDFSRQMQAGGFNRDTTGFNNQAEMGDLGFNRDTNNQNNQQQLADMGFNRDTVNFNNEVNSNFANNTMALAGQRQQLGSNAANIQAGAGDIDRGYEQEALDRGVAGLQRDEDKPLQITQATQGYMMTPNSTTSNTSQKSSPFGTAAAVAGAFISDPLAKTNIKKVDPEDILKRFSKGAYAFDYTEEAKAKGAPQGRKVGMMFDDDYHKNGGETKDIGGYRGKDMSDQVMDLTAAVSALVEKSEKSRGGK
jgi:hypothetical protein